MYFEAEKKIVKIPVSAIAFISEILKV
jgi:hypothetical protein